MFKLSLSKKIFLLIIGLLGIQSFFLFYQSEEMVEEILLNESRKQAQTFLNGLEREILTSDKPGNEVFQAVIDRALEHFDEVNFSIFRLYAFNRQGHILADSQQGNPKTKDISHYLEHVFKKANVYIGDDIEFKTDPIDKSTVAITDIIIPVIKDNAVIAALEVEINLKNTLNNIKKLDDEYDNQITGIIMLSGLLLILFLWFFLKQQIINPILSIEKTAKDITQGNLNSRTNLKGSDEVVHLGHSINTMADSIQSLLDTQEEAYVQVLKSLHKALGAKDPYTAGHSGRVAKYSLKLGKYLKLPEQDLQVLYQGAMMHDLGKIAIPDNILNKPEKLSDEEYRIMCTHPQKTADIMKPLRKYKQHREIAAWHHERWDGEGYPNGLKGEEIPLMARIVSIADTWDAMTGDRVYRKGMSIEKALSILQQERDTGQWEPKLVDAFIEMIKQEIKKTGQEN